MKGNYIIIIVIIYKSDMNIIRFSGGLGNQLFQLGYFLELKKRELDEIKIDIIECNQFNVHNGFEIEKILDIKLPIANICEIKMKRYLGDGIFIKIARKLMPKKSHIIQEKFNFCEEYLNLKDKYIQGFWQSEKFFFLVKDELRELLRQVKLDDINRKLIEKYKDRIIVSLHIRQGDYLNHPLHGGICTKKYYKKAVDYAKRKFDENEIIWLIFSNDEVSFLDYLCLDDIVVVDWNKEEKSFQDMILMSKANCNIIANSSFSWWGAYINDKNIVIGPQKWFNSDEINTSDVMPMNWIRV